MKNNLGISGLNNSISQGGNSALIKNLQAISSLMTYVRVSDIILNENHPKWGTYGNWSSIGIIEYTSFDTAGDAIEGFAIPLFPNIKNYPLIDETVILFSLNNKSGQLPGLVPGTGNAKVNYYLNPVNVWNSQHHNAYPNPFSTGQTSPPTPIFNNPTEDTFVERSNIHPLLPFPGDIIIEGRFGNSIRLGSTAKTTGGKPNNWSNVGNNGDPISIIRNGQDPNSENEGWIPTVENINRDLSSIYLSSTQKLPLVNSTENYKAFSSPPTIIREYNKSQIILNSGRLVFNSLSDDVILSSKKQIALSSEGTIGVSTRKEVVVDSPVSKIGSRFASQSVILGNDFMDQFEELLISLKNLTSALEGLRDWPGGTPIPNATVPPIATITKNVVEQILSLVQDEKDPLLSDKVKVEK
jgi:hypothetical protein